MTTLQAHALDPIQFLSDPPFREMVQRIYELRFRQAKLPSDLAKKILNKLAEYSNDSELACRKVYQEVIHFKTNEIWNNL